MLILINIVENNPFNILIFLPVEKLNYILLIKNNCFDFLKLGRYSKIHLGIFNLAY